MLEMLSELDSRVILLAAIVKVSKYANADKS